jgi:hypothetical protein
MNKWRLAAAFVSLPFFRRGFAPLGCKPLDDASSGL